MGKGEKVLNSNNRVFYLGHIYVASLIFIGDKVIFKIPNWELSTTWKYKSFADELFKAKTLLELMYCQPLENFKVYSEKDSFVCDNSLSAIMTLFRKASCETKTDNR